MSGGAVVLMTAAIVWIFVITAQALADLAALYRKYQEERLRREILSRVRREARDSRRRHRWR